MPAAAASDYEPAPQASTIMCSPGTEDCDHLAANGCETDLSTVANCGACDHNCASCRESPMCNSGTCAGEPKRDFTNCRAIGCTTVGVCMAGECVCPDNGSGGGPDMLRPPFPPVLGEKPPGGIDLGRGCDFAGGGTATATVVLLMGSIFLLLRRRRS